MFLPVIDNEAYNLIDGPKLTGTPERRLLLAMLERAILDFVGNDSLEVDQAQQWIFSDLEDPDFLPFTFSWVCQQLDLDHQRIAKTIKEMPRRGSRRVAPWYFAKQEANKNNAIKNSPSKKNIEYISSIERRLMASQDLGGFALDESVQNESTQKESRGGHPVKKSGLRLIRGKGRKMAKAALVRDPIYA